MNEGFWFVSKTRISPATLRYLAWLRSDKTRFIFFFASKHKSDTYTIKKNGVSAHKAERRYHETLRNGDLSSETMSRDMKRVSLPFLSGFRGVHSVPFSAFGSWTSFEVLCTFYGFRDTKECFYDKQSKRALDGSRNLGGESGSLVGIVEGQVDGLVFQTSPLN